MPVINRDSETWFETTGRDETYVVGDELDIIGDDVDMATNLIKQLIGNPLPLLLYNLDGVTSMTRAIQEVVVVKKVIST